LSRVESERAYVLHRSAWRDTSLIVELFTRNQGRIGCILRGARTPRSPLFGLAEPFRALDVAWTRRGEMATLTGIEPLEPNRRLSGRALWCGLYANELLLTLTPRDDPEPGLFDAYRELLPELNDPARQGRVLRRFELRLLEALGVAPCLDECAASGEAVAPDGRYRVDPVAGPEPVTARDAGFSGRLLLALAVDGPIPAGEDAAALRLMRQLLDHQLDGRRLKTPSLFRENFA
jgi:DNA repair protein RecO (recombination protein O)